MTKQATRVIELFAYAYFLSPVTCSFVCLNLQLMSVS
jgi:hypothetical protein